MWRLEERGEKSWQTRRFRRWRRFLLDVSPECMISLSPFFSATRTTLGLKKNKQKKDLHTLLHVSVQMICKYVCQVCSLAARSKCCNETKNK